LCGNHRKNLTSARLTTSPSSDNSIFTIFNGSPRNVRGALTSFSCEVSKKSVTFRLQCKLPRFLVDDILELVSSQGQRIRPPPRCTRLISSSFVRRPGLT
jgi:hypothetical protein